MTAKGRVWVVGILMTFVFPTLVWGMARQPKSATQPNTTSEVQSPQEVAAPAKEEGLVLPRVEEAHEAVLAKTEASKVKGRDIQVTTGQIKTRQQEEES